MGTRRNRAPGDTPVAYYHCVSRIVNRDFVLGTEEKERLVKLLRTYSTSVASRY